MLRSFIIVLLSPPWISLTDAWSRPSPERSSSSTLALKSDGTANINLYNLLQSNDASTQVVLEGFVSKRRALGSSLAFLDIVPSSLPNVERNKKSSVEELASIAPVQAILRREFWDEENGKAAFDIYHKILQPGAYARLVGTAGPSRFAGEAMLFVSIAEYRLANSNPQHLRNVLRFARDGLLDIEEVQRALPCIENDDLCNGLGVNGKATNKACGELASELLGKFPRNFLLNPSHLMGATNSHKVALLPPVPSAFTKPPTFKCEDHPSMWNDEVVSIASVLQAQVQSNNDMPSTDSSVLLTISGWVQNRRRFQNAVSVLELVEQFSSLASSTEVSTASDVPENDVDERSSKLKGLWAKGRIYCVIHPEALRSENGESKGVELAEIYGSIFCAGARVMLQGLVVGKSFWVSNCRLLRSSWRPSVVRHVLDLLHSGKFAIDEAADSLNLSGGYAQAEDISRGSTEATQRQWMAAELSRSLQGENSRVGRITPAMEQSLNIFAMEREKYPIQQVAFVSSTSTQDNSVLKSKALDILQSNGTPLRTSPEGSRWQRAKKPQLEWMIDQIDQVLKSHPDYGIRKLKLIDIGGGKGLLSNLLAEAFGNNLVEVQVVDISKSAVRNGMMRAKRRGLGNIQYNAQDATTLDLSGVDVVVALHACGSLSDVALGHAVSQGAGFVICPCCFLSNPQLRVPIPAAGKSSSCACSVDEWLDVDASEYESLKQLAELQGDINMAGKAMHSICGLRAAAVERRWRNSQFPVSTISTTIKAFPIGFSTRNICLVGKYELP